MTRHISVTWIAIVLWICQSFDQGQGQATCDFEQGGFCKWINVQGSDNFDWTRNSGSTSSTGTGPPADHTTGTTTGHYIYIEASTPRYAGQRAILKTPVISESLRPTYFEFWYHMYGYRMGELKVSLETFVGGSNVEQLLSLRGQQGYQWQKASVPIRPYSESFRIILEGVIGSGFEGDIAIDDITCTFVNCDITNPCQNNGICRDVGDERVCDCQTGFTGKICDETFFLVSFTMQSIFYNGSTLNTRDANTKVDLSNANSTLYKGLESAMKPEVEKKCKEAQPEITAVKIIRFRTGSLIVDLTVTLNSTFSGSSSFLNDNINQVLSGPFSTSELNSSVSAIKTQDYNNCTIGTHNCGTDATCIANATSYNYSCNCNVGFIGDGLSCSDINECTSGTHKCDRQASCQNTKGSYNCSCETGYIGNGKSCTVTPTATVFCHSERFGISLVRNMTSFATVTLRDTSCTAVSNATHIILSTSFSECGSTKNETNNYIVISNEVKMLGAASGLITRGEKTVIQFSCKYDRSGLETSLVSFQPKTKSVIEARESGFGNFTLKINMARSALFDTYHDSYPVTVEINDRLYFQISLNANNTDAVLLIEKCYVTPTSNKYDATKYSIIENRCPADNTLQFHSGEIYHKKFSFLAFKFVTFSTTIYMHCEVYLCHKSSTVSRCTTGCDINQVANSRQKRDIERREVKEPDFTKTFFLGTGKIQANNPKKESNKGASSVSSSTIAMGASIGILGLALIIIFMVRTIKHTKITVVSQMAAPNGKHALDNKAVEMDNCY